VEVISANFILESYIENCCDIDMLGICIFYTPLHLVKSSVLVFPRL